MQQPQVRYTQPVANASVEDRSAFIWKCYAHVVGGLFAFAAVLSYLIASGIAAAIFNVMTGNWLLVIGALMLVSMGASHAAHTITSTAGQYAAYAVVVVAQATVFSPAVLWASRYPGLLDSAIAVTAVGCVGLIATAMITRKDFSFLRGIVVWGFYLALMAIGASLLFGAQLGTWFSVAMIGYAGVAVLYSTSNVMHHYPQDRYVAASMQLFASIVLMLWYVLQFFLASSE